MIMCAATALTVISHAQTYIVVDTSQIRCYDNTHEITYPAPGTVFYGEDAQYAGVAPAYRDNGDGTVSDTNTGLMWTQDPSEKKTFKEAMDGATSCRVGGHADWRMPAIKELYSLIDFRGQDPNPQSSNASMRSFIDSEVFKFRYGQTEKGERIIDSQFATCTVYCSTTMDGNKTMFGVNFADGRIKGYPIGRTRGRDEKTYYVLYVRGNPDYGNNRFIDNGDGTVTDEATGLTWQKSDGGQGMNWKDALAYAESLQLGGRNDWRLPNAKELQSIVDYTRAPDVTGSAAINSVFGVTPIVNEAGQRDFPCYWTGTTHASPDGRGNAAAYVAFGRAMGYMHGRWLDVHGAGCQRSDPKAGNPADYPQGRGPQGDAIRILNYVRCVRGGSAALRTSGPALENRAVGPLETGARRREAPPSRRIGPRGKRPQGVSRRFVQRLDADGDGKVSREEFDGPESHFPVLDKDHDGYLTEPEAPPPPPRR
jgi:hypothetical protein